MLDKHQEIRKDCHVCGSKKCVYNGGYCMRCGYYLNNSPNGPKTKHTRVKDCVEYIESANRFKRWNCEDLEYDDPYKDRDMQFLGPHE